MTLQDRIVRDPAICGGQPTFRGTRVLLRTVLGYLAHGERTETLLLDFPTLIAAASAAEDLPAPPPAPKDLKVA